MRYRTLLFDADGTLFDFARCEREAVREALLMSGVDADGNMINRYSQINDSLWKKLERGEIEKSVLLYHRFEIFAEEFGVTLDAKQTAKNYMLTLSQKHYMIPGARELLESLSKKADLYMVTNGVESTQRGRYHASHMDLYFKDLFISGAIGHEKPNRGFFDYVAEHIPNFNPDEAIIIGDSLSSDIRGGILYGIDTCWYNPKRLPTPEHMHITRVANSLEEIQAFLLEEYSPV